MLAMTAFITANEERLGLRPPLRRCGEQRTANSEQRTANSEQRTANSEQRAGFHVGRVTSPRITCSARPRPSALLATEATRWPAGVFFDARYALPRASGIALIRTGAVPMRV